MSTDNASLRAEKSARRRALMGRFARTAILVWAAIALIGWGAGLWDVARHHYPERAMPNMARFAFVRALGPEVAMGLVAGLWAGVLAALSRWANRDARRERRAFGIALLLLALAAIVAVARRYPMWAHMAQNAGYTGQSVNVWLGAIMLGVGEYIQSTLAVRVEWISVLGLLGCLALGPAAFIERAVFRKATPAVEAPLAGRGAKAAAWAGLVVVVLSFMSLGALTPKPGDPDRPPVIWISIDTLRCDHMSVYGYERDTTPNLRDLAADGVVVDQFIAAAPWTLPAHASMFSGLTPAQHGVTEQDRVFSPRTPLLGELLKEKGYRNGAVTTALLLAPTFGYDAGFDRYEMNLTYNAQVATERARRWLLGGGKAPEFLFLHLFDPHFPYAAPEPFIGRFGKVEGYMQRKQMGNFFAFMHWVEKNPEERLGAVRDRYDEEVQFTDSVLGWFFTELKKHKIYDRAWIFVSSDHGEEFFDHGSMGHSATMYEELLRIPLIVKAPGSACAGARLSDGQIPATALASMIVEAAGVYTAADVACDAASGVPSLVARHLTGEPVTAESRTFGPVRVAARTPSAKLLSPVDIQKADLLIKRDFEWYDLDADPGETANGYKTGISPELEKAVAAVIEDAAAEPDAVSRRRLDPRTVETLKSLGYLQ